MNIVQVLSQYRASAIEDEAIFTLLCLLYRDGTKLEQEAINILTDEKHVAKRKIADLYKANLILITKNRMLKLTNNAENILSAIGIDPVIRDFLLDAIFFDNQKKYYELIRISLNYDPNQSVGITQSYRNLFNWIEPRTNISSDDKDYFGTICAIHRDSNLWSTLGDRELGETYVLHFSGHGSYSPDIKHYNPSSIAKIFDDVKRENLVLLSACHDATHFDTGNLDSLQRKLSFRTYDWLYSGHADLILESCVSRMIDNRATALWNSIWDDLRINWDSYSQEVGDYDATEVKNGSDLWNYIQKLAEKRTQHPSPYRHQIASSRNNFKDLASTDYEVTHRMLENKKD